MITYDSIVTAVSELSMHDVSIHPESLERTCWHVAYPACLACWTCFGILGSWACRDCFVKALLLISLLWIRRCHAKLTAQVGHFQSSAGCFASAPGRSPCPQQVYC